MYLTELQALSAKCAFGELQEQLMCEQFLEGCSDPKLRERLCKETALTSDRILQVAERLEMERERHQLVAGVPERLHSSQLEVAAVTAQQHRVGDGTLTCYNCGGPHRAADSCCPARWRKCRNCQKKGHYFRFCKVTPKKPKPKKVRTVEVLAVASDGRQDLWTELRVDGQCLRMLTDTGSAVSILPLAVYKNQFHHLPLLPTAVRLEAYGGSSLSVEGVVQVVIRAPNGNVSTASLYVVDAGMPLLGRDLQEQLKLSVVHGMSVCAVQERAPEELPSLSGFIH